MNYRLMLNRDQIDRCRKLAREIATHLGRYIARHSSDGIEQATLRALGVQGDFKDRPLTEWAIEKIGKERLREGAAYWLGAVMVEKACDPSAAAKHLARNGLPAKRPPKMPHGEIRKVTRTALKQYQDEIKKAHDKRQKRSWGRGNERQFVVPIATGNVDQDLSTLRSLKGQGINGVIVRPPLESDQAALIAKGRGWRARYRLMVALDKFSAFAGAKEGDATFTYIWGGLNLAAPEVTVMLALSNMQALEYDALTLARCGKVNFKRAIVDQHFIYRVLAKAGLGAVVSSDRWQGVTNGYSHGHELLMGQLLMEALGAMAGMPLEAISPRHGLVMERAGKSERRDRLVYEVAHAQLVRELFPQVSVGLTVAAQEEDAMLAAAIAAVSGYSYDLLEWDAKPKGAAKVLQHKQEAIAHVNSLLIGFANEISFTSNGKVSRRSHMLVERMLKTFERLQRRDFLKVAAESSRESLFAIPDSGAGLDTLFQKHKYYWNPLDDWLKK